MALQSRKAAVFFFQRIIFLLGMGHAAGLSNGAAEDAPMASMPEQFAQLLREAGI
jgi:hypothetical protein